MTHVSANDGRWNHICASWENKLGSWKLYKNGFLASSGIWLQAGRVIRSGGSLTLAQEQDSPGGRFDKDQCFIGMLTNVNVWNYVLSTAQIKQMSKVCLPGREGNVYKWSDFIHGREGKARVVMPSPCKPQAFWTSFKQNKGVINLDRSSFLYFFKNSSKNDLTRFETVRVTVQ